MKKGETLFRIGDVGTTFYIILKGEVGVHVNIPAGVKKEIGPNGKEIEKQEFVLTMVKTMGAGMSFGELALMDKKPRSATITVEQDTAFAVLEKEPFTNILSSCIV